MRSVEAIKPTALTCFANEITKLCLAANFDATDVNFDIFLFFPPSQNWRKLMLRRPICTKWEFKQYALSDSFAALCARCNKFFILKKMKCFRDSIAVLLFLCRLNKQKCLSVRIAEYRADRTHLSVCPFNVLITATHLFFPLFIPNILFTKIRWRRGGI